MRTISLGNFFPPSYHCRLVWTVCIVLERKRTKTSLKHNMVEVVWLTQLTYAVGLSIGRNIQRHTFHSKLSQFHRSTNFCTEKRLRTTSCYLNNYFNFHVHLSMCPKNQLQFLQQYHKMSQTKVAWYVLKVKNMHSG